MQMNEADNTDACLYVPYGSFQSCSAITPMGVVLCVYTITPSMHYNVPYGSCCITRKHYKIHLHLRGSLKLYSEIAPQIATLPNSFMLGRTVLKNTPPTYIQLHIEALNIASKGKRYVCASLWCETKLR